MAEADYLRGLFEELRDELLAELRAERDHRPMLTVPRVAERLGISERTVRDMLSAGKIASLKVGLSEGSRVVEPAALDAYIAERRAVG